MGKAMLIIVIAAVYTGGYLAFSDKRTQVETTAEQAEDEFKILARNAALTGLNRAEQALANDFGVFEDMEGTHEGSSYTTSSSASGTEIVVLSTATVTTREGADVTFNVRAVYASVPAPAIPDEPPPFMRGLIMSDGDIELNGTPEGYAYMPTDGSEGVMSADVHTNGYLDVKGTSAYFEGIGTYVEGALKDEDWVSQAFQPVYNPTQSKTAFESQKVEIPDIDPALLAITMEADSVTEGSVIVSGVGDIPPMTGTRDDPYVWHISEGGSLFIEDDVQIDGYFIILVDGDVELGGNVTVTPLSYDGEDETSVAIYAGGTVTLTGNAEIWAQIYAGEVEVEAKGTPTFYGGIVSSGQVIFRGTPKIYHRKVSPALTEPWNVESSAMVLQRVSYSEW
jgi:hypothetical protein